jgi:hypothetical protein
MIGDLILEVNGTDIRKSQYNDVAFLLKTLPQGKVSLKIGRFRTSATNSATNSAIQSAVSSKTTSRRNSVTQLQKENKTDSPATKQQVSSPQQLAKSKK